MKIQFNISRISAYLLIALFFTACKSTTSSTIEDINNNRGLLGEWIRDVSSNTDNMVHTLMFTKDSLLTEKITYQNKSEGCENKPELLKRFYWKKIEGTETLLLTVEQHIRCGDQYTMGKQLRVTYQLKDNILKIFDTLWYRAK